MSSGFISENEIAERKKQRQEEWEKVRTADQPIEAPEEEYDHRSLFDRLQEQKQKKDYEYEEAHKLKNMIKGLDDDEVEFLDLVDRQKIEEERKKLLEEARELAEFRSKVASLQEENVVQRIQAEIKPVNPPTVISNRTSQTKLLAGAIKKKRQAESPPKEAGGKKVKTDNLEANGSAIGAAQSSSVSVSERELKKGTESSPNSDSDSKPVIHPGKNTSSAVSSPVLKCIGILPGLVSYNSSDSNSSSSSDDESCNYTDLLGRKLGSESIRQSIFKRIHQRNKQ
ncbi:unnamed protein product [Bemisia tabaci]|uniref:FAM192A/Fyv6 N-terminal domain-containing protein n=1 Tax=Bemisia tabaci TaxID=7038 RepID=A0A9P0A0R3_BEMTA|nr:unnamed protein product [Bemisia tabaci]